METESRLEVLETQLAAAEKGLLRLKEEIRALQTEEFRS